MWRMMIQSLYIFRMFLTKFPIRIFEGNYAGKVKREGQSTDRCLKDSTKRTTVDSSQHRGRFQVRFCRDSSC